MRTILGNANYNFLQNCNWPHLDIIRVPLGV